MNKVLISACLMGSPVRYDGTDLAQNHEIIKRWQQQQRIVPCCPEVAGGLPTPRTPAELQGCDGTDLIAGHGKVITQANEDVTDEFVKGAQQALELCLSEGVQLAILTEKSPSCGSSVIYDGSFQRNKIPGQGVTAALLHNNGIKVFNQHQLEEADQYLQSIDDC